MASKNEHAFIDKVPEEFNCSICTKVLQEPMLTDCCGQHLCKACLENWFETGPGQKRTKTCPHCRSEEFVYIKSLPLKRKISNLEIYCPNRATGCGKQFSLGDLGSHLATCSFVYVFCTKKCGVSLLRNDLQEHCQKTCPNRKVKCQHCGMSGIHEQITGFHLTSCPDVPLVCPIKCGGRGIKRKDLTVHKQECPLEPVQCPFYEAGCKEKLPHEDLEVHTSSSIQQHLQLVMTTSTRNYAQLKAEHQELQQKMEEIVSGVAKEIETSESMSQAQRNTGLQCIKTILLSSTTMLGPEQNYYVHFSELPASWLERKYRTPSIYLRPGYKVYLQNHGSLAIGFTNSRHLVPKTVTSFSLTLETSTKDESLPWPIPNDLEIKVEQVETTESRQPLTISTATFQRLCKVCSPSINLS